MRNKALWLLLAFLLTACHTDELEPEPSPAPVVDPEIIEPVAALNPRIDDGRHVTAYVTYYGKLIPDASMLTHVNYAFAELYMVDGVYNGFKVRSATRFESVAGLKKDHPELKICLSFTHGVENPDNKQGGSFSALCKSEAGRKAFAEDCLAFLQQYNLDGIDLDWEYPGLSWSGAAKDPSCDTDNYVLLVKQLRETLGDAYTISYAGYCMDKQPEGDGWKFIDIKGMDPYVDYVNIMTYDLDEAPNHHSALKDTRAYKDCDRAVRAYMDKGVSPAKLVLGIPFYGRHSWSQSPTAKSYKDIVKMDPTLYRRNKWDDIASCPYVETMAGVFFCGYDNPRSIGIKGEWARKQGMLGLMYWEYDQDDAQGTLRHAVWNAVMTQ